MPYHCNVWPGTLHTRIYLRWWSSTPMNASVKCLPYLRTYLSLVLLPKSPICWKFQPIKSSCSHSLLILKIIRACLHKNLKSRDFQQIGYLAQAVACRAVKWDNISLLDFLVFSLFYIIYRILRI